MPVVYNAQCLQLILGQQLAPKQRACLQLAHYLEADTRPWAQYFWQLSSAPLALLSPRAPSALAAEPLAQCLPADTKALLASAHDDVVTALYAAHPVVADVPLPMVRRLAALPECAGAAADAAALRSCLVASAHGPCLTVDPCSPALCARVVAAIARVHELRAIALRLPGDACGTHDTALPAAVHFLRLVSGSGRVAVRSIEVIPAATSASRDERELASWLATLHTDEHFALRKLAPDLTSLRLPCVSPPYGFSPLSASLLSALTGLRRLQMTAACSNPAPLRVRSLVVGDPHLHALRHLDVSGSLQIEGTVRLVPAFARQLRLLPHLRCLRACANRLCDEHIITLLSDRDAGGHRSAALRGLRRLDIGGNRISCSAEAACVLCSMCALYRLDVSSNSIDDAGADALAQSLSRLTALRHFDLSCNPIRRSGAATFAVPFQLLTKLSTIKLTGVSIGGAESAALAPVLAALPWLRDLAVRQTQIGAACVAGSATALHRLEIGGVRPACARQLAAVLPSLDKLRHLQIELCDRTLGVACKPDAAPDAFSELLQSLLFQPQLQSVTLSGDAVWGPASESALRTAMPALTALTRLDVGLLFPSACDWVQALPASLACLRLRGRWTNQALPGLATWQELSEISAEPILGSLPSLTQLRTLVLAHCMLSVCDGHEWGAALAALTRLQDLELVTKFIDLGFAAEAAPSLARIDSLTRLRIDGSCCDSPGASTLGVRDAGAAALGRHLCELTRLQCLDLRNNGISRKGAVALEGALTRLAGLELSAF